MISAPRARALAKAEMARQAAEDLEGILTQISRLASAGCTKTEKIIGLPKSEIREHIIPTLKFLGYKCSFRWGDSWPYFLDIRW